MSTLCYSTSQPTKKELEQQLMDSADDIWDEIVSSMDEPQPETAVHPVIGSLNTDIPKLSKN